MNVGTLKAFFQLDATKFNTSIKQVEGRMTKASTNMSKQSAKLSSSLERTARSVGKISLALGAVAAVGTGAFHVISSIAKAKAGLDSMHRSLTFAVGSTAKARKEYEYLIKTSNRLGLSAGGLAADYGKLAAAAKGTKLEGAGVREIFESIASASAVMGLSSEQTSLALKALQQMISKGKISAEELRGQLGEQIPGALNIMARSLGVSTEKLDKLMKDGFLFSEEVLRAFAQQLQKEVSPQLKELGESTQATLGQMNTAFLELKSAVLDSPMFSVIVAGLKGITAAASLAARAFTTFNSAFDTYVAYVKRHRASVAGGGGSPLEAGGDGEESAAPVTKTGEAFKFTAIWVEQASNHLAAFQERLNAFKVPEAAETMVQIFDAGISSIQSFEDSIVNFVQTGKFSLESLARNIIAEMTKIAVKIQVTMPLMQAWAAFLQGASGGGASGGGFLLKNLGKLIGFSSGGVLSEPVIGVGLKSNQGYSFAENAPEAIVPFGSSGGGVGASLGGNVDGGFRNYSSSLPSSSSGGSGGGGSSDNGGQGAQNFNINISAVDSESLVKLMRTNPEAITVPLSESINMGDRGTINSIRGAF